MDILNEIAGQIEIHSVEGIKECFSKGVNPNDIFKGEPLIYELTSEYGRTERFKDCIRVFVDNGLEFEDKVLLSVLLDDAISLEDLINNNKELVFKKYTLRCAFMPLYEATLLHICAEFNHVSCAKVLVNYGADVNAKAGADEYGFGGQTPIFHTVNQNLNNSIDMINYLLSQSVDLKLTVTGLIWGKGYDWETLIPAVNPISYAMMGLLPQMHRREITISKIVALLLKHEYGIDYTSKNIPCKYLNSAGMSE
jgi:hypothetical protein